MQITYDENKRLEVLAKRNLDFRDAIAAFESFHLTRRDDRDYEEDRFISLGEVKGEVVLIVWTMRDDSRRIITMWKASYEEREKFYHQRDQR